MNGEWLLLCTPNPEKCIRAYNSGDKFSRPCYGDVLCFSTMFSAFRMHESNIQFTHVARTCKKMMIVCFPRQIKRFTYYINTSAAKHESQPCGASGAKQNGLSVQCMFVSVDNQNQLQQPKKSDYNTFFNHVYSPGNSRDSQFLTTQPKQNARVTMHCRQCNCTCSWSMSKKHPIFIWMT